MTTTTATTTDIAELAAAIERRDAAAITSWYAVDAILTIIDRDHPPSAPSVTKGTDAIHAYFAEVCGRNIEHEVRDAIATPTGLAFTQYCRYPEGSRVVCSTTASLSEGKIVTQTAVQAWDE